LVISLVFLGMHEFYNLAIQKVTNPEKIIGISTGVTVCLMMYFGQVHHLWILFISAFLALITVELFRNEVGPLLNVSTTFAGIFYIGATFGCLILIRELPNLVDVKYILGGYFVILTFLSIWVCDSAAYILGARFGKHKLFERVSPNKTVEGTVFGFLFALLTAFLCHLFFLKEVPLIHLLAVGAICGSFGQVSDLIESLFKRDARVKDSSDIIPGHGGILDRFDSEIVVAPLVYFYLKFIVFNS